jgi:ABC-type Na+ efflux pump permease subunit
VARPAESRDNRAGCETGLSYAIVGLALGVVLTVAGLWLPTVIYCPFSLLRGNCQLPSFYPIVFAGMVIVGSVLVVASLGAMVYSSLKNRDTSQNGTTRQAN